MAENNTNKNDHYVNIATTENSAENLNNTDYNKNLLIDKLQSSSNNNSSTEDQKYMVKCNIIEIENKKNKKNKKLTNEISTSKYRWFNCIPLILIEQFSKMSNIYFLIIALFQLYKEISNADGKPVMLMPLAIVVCVNGIKDFYEDLKRKRSDDEENNKNIKVYNKINNTFENKKWMEITPGNIIKIENNQFIPADCVFIGSNDKNNNCYIETKNLDGETNLKFKKCIKELINSVKENDDNNNSNENIISNSISNENNNNNNINTNININTNNSTDNNNNKNDNNLNNHDNTVKIDENKFSNFEGVLTTKPPNELIYEFNAVFKYLNTSNVTDVIIDNESFLLRGCSIKQTEYAYGLVVYVGHDTKIMKNSPKARHKISTIENLMNKQIIFIFIFQMILSFAGAIFCMIQLHGDIKVPYLHEKTKYNFKFFLIKLGTWIVLLNNLVPISLLVTMEMVKYVQGLFISWDYQMYDLNTRTQPKVQTSTLNEELGQVKYIFSDKTGTLTKNYMTFKKMVIGNYSYGRKINTSNKNENENVSINPNLNKDEYGQITNFDFYDDTFNNHIELEDNSEIKKNIDLFMMALATCHSVIIDEKQQLENNIISYNSSSPDETALLNCARYFKYIFNGRDINNKISIINKNNKQQKYDLLCNFAYTSERKRMSVIIKYPNNKIFLFIKGADSAILPKVNKKDPNIENIKQHLSEYAKEGLRTLMIAYREIDEKEFEEIHDEYINALCSTYEKQKLLDALSLKIENNLTILGITGIEDKLQDNVDDVLKSLNIAGIKIWVLTGDKKETAKSIAYSCKLLDNESFTIFDFKEGLDRIQLLELIQNYSKAYNAQHLNSISIGSYSISEYDEHENNYINYHNNNNKNDNIENSKTLEIQLNNNNNNVDNKKIDNKIQEKLLPSTDKDTMLHENFAICISQEELSLIMSNPKLEKTFYELANRCQTVLCCRVTPKQKAQMVNLIKKNQPSITTLAIGDGANDVNMISTANIGIGILGVEGKQAARASDYAIGQFQFLKKLLFVHGRESYRKNSFIVVYNFYKNFLFVIPQFILGFRSLFGGQTIYDKWIYQLYNILFAAFPIIWYGVYDKQVEAKKLLFNPKYYTQGIVNRLFGSFRFWKWIFYGIIQGLILYIASFELVRSPMNSNGDTQDLALSGTVCYSFVVIIANIKVIQASFSITVANVLIGIISIFLYYFCVWFQSFFSAFYNFDNFHFMMTSLSYYLKTLIIILACCSIDLGIKLILKNFGFIPDPLKLNVDYNESLLDENSELFSEDDEDVMSRRIELNSKV